MRLGGLFLCILALQVCVYVALAETCEPGAVCKIVGTTAKASASCSTTEDCPSGQQCLGNNECGTVGTPYEDSDIVSGRTQVVDATSSGKVLGALVSVVSVIMSLTW